jgi:hypothetical protein
VIPTTLGWNEEGEARVNQSRAVARAVFTVDNGSDSGSVKYGEEQRDLSPKIGHMGPKEEEEDTR